MTSTQPAPALGVDLGGTNVRAAAVMPDGRIVARRQLPTNPQAGLQEVLDRVAEAVAAAATEAQLPDDAPVGVALPGAINPYTGFLYMAPNLHWHNLPIRDLMEERLQRRVTLGNDVNAAALGEWRYGEGRGTQHLVFLACGTGVGGGVIINGQLLLGQHGLAAELGHMVIQVDGPLCHCGGKGCLEAFASGWAIERDAQDLLDRGVPSILTELMVERGEALSGTLVNYAASQDDGLAIEILARAGRALGFAVASLAHIFNPEVVAIGGGVMTAGKFLLDPMHEAVKEHLISGFGEGLRIVPSALGQDAGLLGAAALASGY